MRSSATAGRAGAGARSRSSRSATTATAARSPWTRSGGTGSRSRRGSTATPGGSTSTIARSPPARRTSPASSQRAWRSSATGPSTSGARPHRGSGRATVTASHGASPPLEVDVERERARAGVWYELFPRSWGGLAGVVEVVPELAELGFDVLYLPPIHPIGETNRKGRNNAERAAPGDVGSPWAIGGAGGGHDAIHPDLGTEDDLAALVAALRENGMELALDLALQASPDHPWLARASRVVPAAPGRLAQVRREPAEALPGHPQLRLGHARPEGALEGDPRRRPPLVRRRRDRVPRRQPAHEARPVLGVADRRRSGRSTRRRCSSPRRSRARR